MIQIRVATVHDAEAVTAIYNLGIEERSATFETAPRRVEDIAARIQDAERYPLLVANDNGTVVGWAGLSNYRPRECYAGIAEFSVYLATTARGRGIGKQLLQALIDVGRERGFWKLISRIFLFNQASRALCRAVGFREVGIYEKHGPLEGLWLDVVIVELLIPENIPSAPSAPSAAEAAVAP